MTSAYCAGSFNFWKWWTIRPDIEARSLRRMRKVEEVHSDIGSGAGIAGYQLYFLLNQRERGDVLPVTGSKSDNSTFEGAIASV
jgi:hypothetical protein